MENRHFAALLITLSLYFVLAISFFGWGKAVVVIKNKIYKTDKLPYTFFVWIGWIVVLFIFQLLNFFLPLNLYSVSPVFLIGVVLFIIFLIKDIRSLELEFSPIITISSLFLLLGISAWVSSRSMLFPVNYDSGLYHFAAIRWINNFPIIPGLGNLHGRLAFNSSFFTYVAALNFYPFFGLGRVVANSFLLILCFMTLMELSLPKRRKPKQVNELSPLEWGPSLFCLTVIAYWAMTSSGLASPSPDLTLNIVQMILFVIFVKFIHNFFNRGRYSLDQIFLISILSSTAVTIKLSSLVFSFFIIFLSLIVLLRASEKPLRDSTLVMLPALLIFFTWSMRCFILSGAPLYPSSLGYINVEWAVPIKDVVEEANWVYSWARQPRTHLTQVLGNWNWFIPWLQRMAKNFTEVVFPISMFLIITIINLFLIFFGKINKLKWLILQVILVLPVMSGLIFWFFTAPDPRFAHAQLMLLPAASFVILFALLQETISKKILLSSILCFLFIIGNFNLLKFFYINQQYLQQISMEGWHGVLKVPLNERTTNYGIPLLIPAFGDQCWDAPLPCAPSFKENLRLRDPSDITAGFTIQEKD